MAKKKGKRKNRAAPPAPAPPRESLLERMRRRELAVVIGILLLALGLRVGHLFAARANDPFFFFPSVDPLVYQDWATRIAGGEVTLDEPFYMGPLYAYFLGAIYAVFGVGLVVGRVVQIGLGLITVWLAYRVGRRVYGVEVGWLAAFFLAIYEPSIFYEGLFAVAPLQAALNLIVVLLLLRCHDRPTWPRWAAAGAMLGVAALARPNVLLMAGLVVVWIALGFRKTLDLRARALRAAAFCVGVGLAVLPATIHNGVCGGDPVLVSSSGGVNFYIGNGQGATGTFRVPEIFERGSADKPLAQREVFRKHAEAESGRSLAPSEVSGFWYDRTWAQIGADPGVWIWLLGRKLSMAFHRYELPSSRHLASSREFSWVLELPLPGFSILGTLALVGLFLGWRRDGSAVPLHALVVTIVLGLMLFFVLGRYRHTMAPILAVFAAVTVVTLIGAWRRGHIGTFWLGLAGVAFAALLVNRDVDHATTDEFVLQYNLGNKYRQMERYDEAVERYRRSLALNPDYLWTHNNLARVLQRKPETLADALRVWRGLEARARRMGSAEFVQRARQSIDAIEKLYRSQGVPIPR